MPENALTPNAECTDAGHKAHLCSLMYEGFHYSHREEYKALVRNADYRCRDCARTAKDAANLCSPVAL